ncbi:MAG: phosphoribosylformylglycinamidine synthase subunit PurQ [Sphingomonadales bacterium]
MKSAVIVFPGSNCDRDIAVALEQATGAKPAMVWHGEGSLPDVDLIALPGGFSYGDYLRCGAVAANSPIMKDVKAQADRGTLVLGICNGFQVLTESGLLPGALMRNANLAFICRDTYLRAENTASPFTNQLENGQVIRVPIAHHDGNFFADTETLKELEDKDRVAFRYCDGDGTVDQTTNPNGSLNSIAGIFNDRGNVLGMMPHPERLADPALGGVDGKLIFESLISALF